jgi:NADH dehydrogenase FAD-containing subunit
MKHIVLAGAGHAHLQTIQNIRSFVDDGVRVTVVGPSEEHYYSGMGPGMLGGFYQPGEIRFAIKKQVEEQGGIFVCDVVTGVDPKSRKLFLQSGTFLQYDLLSFNTGSSVHLPPVSSSHHVYPVKPIEELAKVKATIESLASTHAIKVAVIGGGPAGVEIGGNVAHLLSDTKYASQTHLYAGHKLLAGFSPFVQRQTRLILEKKGIRIREEGYLRSIKENILHFDDGTRDYADCIIVCTGVHPGSFFKEAGLPTGDDGGLLVNRTLQCTEYPEIFGGGDCISFEPCSLAKVGVYAVRENPVLLHNLKAFLKGGKLQDFVPGGDYLLIFNLGDSKGVLRKKWFQISGILAFRIKDFIDKRFMKQFR